MGGREKSADCQFGSRLEPKWQPRTQFRMTHVHPSLPNSTHAYIPTVHVTTAASLVHSLFRFLCVSQSLPYACPTNMVRLQDSALVNHSEVRFGQPSQDPPEVGSNPQRVNTQCTQHPKALSRGNGTRIELQRKEAPRGSQGRLQCDRRNGGYEATGL